MHLGEVNALAADAAARGFEALDVDKEAADELDHRLKWLGLFHKRKHHYGRFMMRLKLPGGFVSGAQLRVLAAAIARYGDDGCADITTRQNIQLRGITLPDVPALLAALEGAGMSSLQSGLDNVRNAVGNPLAGIDPEEVMDSRPATDALHAYVLSKGRGNPEISNLPRKWNVCVVGSHELWEHPHINDLAYLPAERDGVAGYNLIVGGYISVQRAIESVPLDAWVPAGDAVVSLCHAVLTVFRDYGSRGNRQKCRMMWLVEEMGVERFRAEVAARMPGGVLARAAPRDLLRTDWERRSYLGVHAQKQAGLHWVGCSVPGGRMDAADLAALGDLADAYGNGEVRLTVEQNFIIAGVPTERVAALLAEPLLAAFTPFPGRLMGGLVACTGNQFCGFSQIETKQTAWRVAEHLESVLELPRDIRMMWTGCPNSCGQVQVADIGLMGCMVKAEAPATGMVPGVDVFVGGRVGADSHLATVTHPSVRMDDLLPLLEGVLVEQFGATRKAVPSPNKALHTRFRLAAKPAGPKPAPKGTPKKAGNATHICADCGYIYNQPTALAAQPEDFACPACGAPKDRFRPLNDSAAESSGCDTRCAMRLRARTPADASPRRARAQRACARPLRAGGAGRAGRGRAADAAGERGAVWGHAALPLRAALAGAGAGAAGGQPRDAVLHGRGRRARHAPLHARDERRSARRRRLRHQSLRRGRQPALPRRRRHDAAPGGAGHRRRRGVRGAGGARHVRGARRAVRARLRGGHERDAHGDAPRHDRGRERHHADAGADPRDFQRPGGHDARLAAVRQPDAGRCAAARGAGRHRGGAPQLPRGVHRGPRAGGRRLAARHRLRHRRHDRRHAAGAGAGHAGAAVRPARHDDARGDARL